MKTVLVIFAFIVILAMAVMVIGADIRNIIKKRDREAAGGSGE